ncbi:MAG: hypothetical protein U0360_06930 [Dehalococcoidia bacterium]
MTASPQGGQDPDQSTARWIAGQRDSAPTVLRALGQVLMAVAGQDAPGLLPPGTSKGDAVTQRELAMTSEESLPRLAADASPDEIQLWLADTRTRAHRLIDESVAEAQEALNRRHASIEEGDATAQAQRHAQRLAVERLRRAIGDLTLEIRGVHGRLDRLETMLRTAIEARPAAALAPVATATPVASPAPSAAPIAAPPAPEPIAPRATAPAAAEALRSAVDQARRAGGMAPLPNAAASPRADLDRPTRVPAEPHQARETPQPEMEPATNRGATPDVPTADRVTDEPPAPSVTREGAPTTGRPSTEPEARPAGGFAADARAAVEAAVASALQEARRAAAVRTSAKNEALAGAEASDGTVDVERRQPAAPRMVEPRAAVTPTPPNPSAPPDWPRLAPETPRVETPDEAPTRIAAELAPETPSTRTSPEPDASPAAAAAKATEPATRPSLWVPPSAIAPPRVSPAPARAPESQAPAAPAAEPQAEPAAALVSAPPSAPAPVSPAPAAAAVAPAPVAPVGAAGPRTASAPAAEPRFGGMQAATVERARPAGLFEADGGPVVLRVAPISGFQGLMRVQDAVVQHAPVREATVEAYARGEARLRLQLVSTLDAEQLAATLVRSLGLQAKVEAVSAEERSIQVTLA